MTESLSLDPVLHETWHPVALSRTVIFGGLHAVSLLGEDLVLWRGETGLLAWQDLCVHRGVKLSLGKVTEAGTLRCAYHGWTYDETGRCVQMPAHPGLKPPERARVRSYLCREEAGLIWVSLDELALFPPMLGEFQDDSFRILPCGPYPANAGAPRLIENFLDVAHLPIVHEGALGVSDLAEIAPYEVELVDGRPMARDIRIFQPDPEGLGKARMTTYEYGVLSPFLVYLRKHMAGEACFTLLFAVCPISEAESVAWFSIAMNYGDPQNDGKAVAFQSQIFAQDLPIVTSQRPELLPLDLAEELHLPSDRLAIAYRKYLRAQGLSFGTA